MKQPVIRTVSHYIAQFFMLAGLLCQLPAQAMEALSPSALDEQHSYRVEVLQVTDIAPYQDAYDGFLAALAEKNLVPGKNLVVNRAKIDFDVEKGGFWDKVGLLFRIRDEAWRIVRSKPDLVLTIGTPATKYARSILHEANIPVVFTAVANPLDANCVSITDAGAGVTGATLYMEMADSLKMVKQLFPAIQRIGMINTDDDNGIAHVAAVRSAAQPLGVTVLSRQVNKRDSIIPALKALVAPGQSAQLFAVPLDTYYGLRHFEPAHDLSDFGEEYGLPVVSFALVKMPGAVLYSGVDFRTVGMLSGTQAAKILLRHVKPDILPILRQEKPMVLIDPQRAAALHLALPAALMQHAHARQDGLWQIDAP